MMTEFIGVAAFVSLVTFAIGTTIIVVRRDGRDLGNIIKQLIIWVTIVVLLPLTSYAGANMLHPRHKMRELEAQRYRADMETYDTKETDARKKSRDEAEEFRKQVDVENREFYQAMFWISFPIGFAALLVGLFMNHISVGTGLAVGGLATLTEGCYSYWNDMGDTLRFVSLLVTLVVIVGIGLARFGRTVSLKT